MMMIIIIVIVMKLLSEARLTVRIVAKRMTAVTSRRDLKHRRTGGLSEGQPARSAFLQR